MTNTYTHTCHLSPCLTGALSSQSAREIKAEEEKRSYLFQRDIKKLYNLDWDTAATGSDQDYFFRVGVGSNYFSGGGGG